MGPSWPNLLSLTSHWCLWDLFRSFKVSSDAADRVGCGEHENLPHLFIPRKTATLVPKFAVEDLPLGRTAAFVPEFAVNDLPLGRTF